MIKKRKGLHAAAEENFPNITSPSRMLRIHPVRLIKYALYGCGSLLVFMYIYSHLRTAQKDVFKFRRRAGKDQPLLDYMGQNLDVHYDLVSHVDYRSEGLITFTNKGQLAIPYGNWSIYIFYMSPIDTELHNYGNGPNPQFRITRLNGNLYRISPTMKYHDLLPSDRVTLEVTSGTWIMAYTDLLPNWYVGSRDAQPRILESTREGPGKQPDFVSPFLTRNTRKRSDDDPIDVYTPEVRYRKHHVTDFGGAAHMVLPTPLSVRLKKAETEHMTIGTDWQILSMPRLDQEAKLLKDMLGLTIAETRPSAKFILLTIGNVPLEEDKYRQSKEAYYVDVSSGEQKIVISGNSPAAVFYGVQTLLSMISPGTGPPSVPVVKVMDAPRFEYRGLMIDLSRNFHKREELTQVLDAMGTFKLNKLHLHLADDEGWRLEIPGLEELTDVGSKRCHDIKERECILPALGSGPFTNSSGSGYLSVDDYRYLLRFAKLRHIEIIPEFDMPGHGRAAIKSMEARFTKKRRQGSSEEAGRYLLSDPMDDSKYMSGQFFSDNAINPCLESTYEFVNHLIQSVQSLHEDISPLRRFHFGGDEVPENAYMESPACRAYMRSHPELADTKDLKIHFIKRIAAIAAKHHLGLQGWEDAFYGKYSDPMDKKELHTSEVVTNVWWNMWEAGIGHRANDLANADYKVVLSHSTHFYFDHVQEPDPAERGLYWAIRYIDTRRTFNYIPDDIYENIDLKGWGDPWSRDEACKDTVKCVPLIKPENVIGLQGQVWGETVRTKDHLDLMVFPRLLALAERAWHKAPWESMQGQRRKTAQRKDWTKFANTLGYDSLKKLERIGIRYYLPPPGCIEEGGELKVNTAFPGLVVQFSEDEGSTWRDWKAGTKVSDKVLLATRSHDGKRRSRSIRLNTYRLEEQASLQNIRATTSQAGNKANQEREPTLPVEPLADPQMAQSPPRA